MSKKRFVPGFPLALRELVDETEQIINATPFVSKMPGYCAAVQTSLEEAGFEPLKADRRARVDMALRKRGYVIGLKVGGKRLSPKTLEALAEYKADYRIVVLKDWNIYEEPRRNLSGVDQVLTPFQGRYTTKNSSVKRFQETANDTENVAENEDYKDEAKPRSRQVRKNAENHGVFPSSQMLSHVRARKSPEGDHLDTSEAKRLIQISSLPSVEKENLDRVTSNFPEREVRSENQNSRSGLAVGKPSKNIRIDPKRMEAAAHQARKVRGTANASDRVRLQGRRCRIDWSELDQTGRPVLSFEPTDSHRPALLKILTRDARDRTRQACVRKLGVELSRIYERYRAACNRRDGKLGTTFRGALLSAKHRQYCEEIAVLCIELAVTPRALLEYWDKNIKDFTDGQVTVPPLAFLKSASVIDRVACSSFGTVGKSDEGRERKGKNSVDRNPYADLSRFDARLRPMLDQSGFDTTRYNDRYLLSVQHNAIAVARGADLLLVPGQFGDMIKTAADWYKTELNTEYDHA